jgi:hypothetical protein
MASLREASNSSATSGLPWPSLLDGHPCRVTPSARPHQRILQVTLSAPRPGKSPASDPVQASRCQRKKRAPRVLPRRRAEHRSRRTTLPRHQSVRSPPPARATVTLAAMPSLPAGARLCRQRPAPIQFDSPRPTHLRYFHVSSPGRRRHAGPSPWCDCALCSLQPRGISMSGSMAPDPRGRAARRCSYLRSGLIIAISLISSQNIPHGLPGTPSGGSGEPFYCPRCGEPGSNLPGGLHRCKNKHWFTSAQAKRKEGKA